MTDVFFVWDGDGLPPEGNWKKILWRGFIDKKEHDSISIPQLVEENSDFFKYRYLAWIFELGETHVDGKRLVDHLEVRSGFSYWWMTLIAEKCNWAKSPQINDTIRFLAFESLFVGQSVPRVILATSNAALAECMKLWCCAGRIIFEWRVIREKKESKAISQRIYRALPHLIKALPALVYYLIQRWPLRGAGVNEWRNSEGRTTFFSYFFNMVPEAEKKGCFDSRYWAHLPDILKQEGCQTNWLHLYVHDVLHPTAKVAAETIRKFNRAGKGLQIHVMLDSFLNLAVIFNAIRDWIFIVRVGLRLQRELFSLEKNQLIMMPLFREDWSKSMFGFEALLNALFLNLFETALSSLPKQGKGFFLQENQPWEYALIHAWRSAGHGQILGAPHTTVPYWDLRSFFDSRSYKYTGQNDLPLPDLVALNGIAALNAYLKGGYPKDKVVEVEALRYLHLHRDGKETIHVPAHQDGSLKLLVLGDYGRQYTIEQMSMLVMAVNSVSKNIIITVKPHPSCPIIPENYPDLKMVVTMEPVSILLKECDVVYTSNMTSAAVDAYCADVPVISVLDPNTLNLSPLRGFEGVSFVSSPAELSEALVSAALVSRSDERREHFFTLDPRLNRWRRLLLA